MDKQTLAKKLANWLINDFRRVLKKHGMKAEESPLTPEALAEFIHFIDRTNLAKPVAKEVFERMVVSGKTVTRVLAEIIVERHAEAT